MNKRIKELMLEAGYAAPEIAVRAQKFAELIVKECANICMEMSANGALAKDCAYWIKNDFGVE